MIEEILLFTREQLYEEVWSTSMVQLAKKYGVTSRGLTKLCTRMNVPVPGVGYWAKVKAGFTMPRLPLPKQKIKSSATKESSAAPPLIKIREPTSIHPLVEATRKALSAIEPWEGQKHIISSEKDILDVSVTPETLNRAMVIMNHLLNAFEERSLTVKNSIEQYKQVTRVFRDTVSIKIKLAEPLNKYVTYKSGEHNWYGYSSSGTLWFEILDHVGVTRKKWRDGRAKRVEDSFSEIILAVEASLLEAKASRIKYEQIEARVEEACRIERLRLAEEARQLELLQKLENEATFWQRARTMREYLAAAEALVASGEIKGNDADKVDSWLKESRLIADKLDPVTGNWGSGKG